MPRQRHGGGAAGAANRLRNLFDRGETKPSVPGAESNPGEKDTDHHPLYGDRVQFVLQNSSKRLSRLTENGSPQSHRTVPPVPSMRSAKDRPGAPGTGESTGDRPHLHSCERISGKNIFVGKVSLRSSAGRAGKPTQLMQLCYVFLILRKRPFFVKQCTRRRRFFVAFPGRTIREIFPGPIDRRMIK